MARVFVGFDVGSTFTKFCILDEGEGIISLESFQTPAVQRDFFKEKLQSLAKKFTIAGSASCGYGRGNIDADVNFSELVALAKGVNYIAPTVQTVLDIGGQDSKAICCRDGKLLRFSQNDKCAAGSGLFLQNALRIVELSFERVSVGASIDTVAPLSTVCAVFAQTEIIRMVSQGVPPMNIIHSVLFSIAKQAAALLKQVNVKPDIAFTGGLSLIPGMGGLLSEIVGRDVLTPNHSTYLSAIGCAVHLSQQF
jgi:predicted CoA-substrate-specific enzyme activase